MMRPSAAHHRVAVTCFLGVLKHLIQMPTTQRG